MSRQASRQLPHSLRSTCAGPLAGLLVLWLATTAIAEPELTATGAAIATGSDLLETSIVVEKFEPAHPPDRPLARFVPAKRFETGDEVHYTIRVRNPGAEAVTGVQVTKRMPRGLHYLLNSATGPACDIEFSIDGGTTYAVQPGEGDYTHVRWTMRRPLPAGSTALLRFRATFR